MTRFAKFKQRFRRALFAFFKEEILDAVGHHAGPDVQVISTHVKFTEISASIRLTEDRQTPYGPPAHVLYEKGLEQARRSLFEESMKYIRVDERSVVDPHLYDSRAITVSLLIAKNDHRPA